MIFLSLCIFLSFFHSSLLLNTLDGVHITYTLVLILRELYKPIIELSLSRSRKTGQTKIHPYSKAERITRLEYILFFSSKFLFPHIDRSICIQKKSSTRPREINDVQINWNRVGRIFIYISILQVHVISLAGPVHWLALWLLEYHEQLWSGLFRLQEPRVLQLYNLQGLLTYWYDVAQLWII
jgi:hypothetical protein